MSETHEFDFAISFAGPQRKIAARLAQCLAEHRFCVFYDNSYRGRLLGRRLDRDFKWIFGAGTLFFVPIVSEAYVERPWPQLEWSVAKQESDRRASEFILPLRIDDSLLLGLPEHIGYLDLREYSIEEAVVILSSKAEALSVSAHIPVSQIWVATFGINMEDLYDLGLLPSDAPTSYPQLCDWLENDLLDRVRESGLKDSGMPEASARNGETLSVRVAFEWSAEQGPLEFGELAWWEVLEILPFEQIYETQNVE